MTELVTEKEAARKVKLSVATLRRRRVDGRPPKWVKLGATVRYKVEELDAWVQSCTVGDDGTKNGQAA